MRKASAVTFTDVGQVELASFDLPDLRPGELLIRTDASAVSPGTEMRCLAGRQADSVAFPYIPGYSMAGVVEAVSPGCPNAVGDRVFASGTRYASINLQWGGHVSHAITSSDSVVLLPNGCASHLAAMAKLVAIALRGVRVCKPKPSDLVAVVGLGPIGMLSARLYRTTGAKVLSVDQEASRVELARAAGMEALLVDGTIEETVFNYFGQGADVVVDATGIPEVLPFSIAAARQPAWGNPDVNGPKLVIQGSYPNLFTIPYPDAFRKELTILMPRDTTPNEVRDAVMMIADGTCRVDDLISWFGDPGECAKAYGLLKNDRTTMTAGFDWSNYAS